MDKLIQLQNLARKRQATIRGGYKNIGDFHNGIYECDFVSPYTKSACNIDAPIMIMLQDWVGVDKLSGPIIQDAINLGHIPSLPTNKRLKELLERHFHLSLSDTYATNLFPFIKYGNLSANIPLKDMVWAAQQFGVPQIEIVQPDIVICLGLRTFNALRKSVGLLSCPTIGIAIKSVFAIGKSKIFCQAHTGTLGQIGRRYEQVELDWCSMSRLKRHNS
ncbi:hypothetical protein [Cellvibrio mixtus]|uniref:hypothetical protein n=1 Tax=Cellvibrio mixtus TaxID=39650 RepID=UPI0005875022|nr:hypothetical protein [Cellvibrio mixtus]